MDEKKTIRVAQFMPFDSLSGFRDALKEKERIVVEKKELSEDSIEEINEALQMIKKLDMVEIVYYDNEDYVKLTGIVFKIDKYNRFLQIVNQKVKFDNIYFLKIIKNNV